jgi:hypothetical protein
MGKAIDALKTLKAGDHVVLTCTDDDRGGHLGVTAIKLDTKPEPPKQG